MGNLFKRKGVMALSVVWLLVVVAILASTVTLLITDSKSASAGGLHFVSSDEYEILQRFSRLEEIYKTLMDEYYIPLDGDGLITGAIRGMMSAVDDPYTFYYTVPEMTAHEEDNKGIYHGIGVTVSLHPDGGVLIVKVYSGSPAEEAGLLEGDVIVAADGVNLTEDPDVSLSDAVSLIKGEDGTYVELTVLREGETLVIPCARGPVNVQYTEYQILEGNIGYISITQFTGNATEGLRRAIEDLKAADVAGVIVDVRDNPGGTLDVVLEITDAFLPKCEIVYIEDRAGARVDYFADADCWDVPLAVLINGNSASASEIFAAAIKENGRGVVVGTSTFGKGIVQTLITFPEDGAGMQYTSARYFTPLGNSIHGTGVEPDIVMEMGDSAEDVQLQAAIKALGLE